MRFPRRRHLRFAPMNCAILLPFCLELVSYSFAADRNPAFVDPVIRLSANASRDVTVVKIKVEGLTKTELDSKTLPQLVDATQPAPPGTLTFTFLRSEDVGAAARLWYFTAAIQDLPASQTQRRQAEIQFESIKEKIDYTL